jgi:hypothetical protein
MSRIKMQLHKANANGFSNKDETEFVRKCLALAKRRQSR